MRCAASVISRAQSSFGTIAEAEPPATIPAPTPHRSEEMLLVEDHPDTAEALTMR
jgi:hypothetical protein